MKKLLAYSLLLLYTTVSLKPVLPVFCDALSHLFAEARHLTTVHAHYGSHHLDHELANAGEEQDAHNSNHTVKAEEPLLLHLAPRPLVFGQRSSTIKTIHPCRNAGKLPVVFLATHCPPPRSAFLSFS